MAVDDLEHHHLCWNSCDIEYKQKVLMEVGDLERQHYLFPQTVSQIGDISTKE